MDIYDRFPLVDGTLFISPYCYDKQRSIPVNVSEKNQFIYGVCLKCLNSEKGHEIKCKHCYQLWTGGDWVQIGTLYKYDIFAAFPCCKFRLSCKKCGTAVVNQFSTVMQFFSKYSEPIECPNCFDVDYHCIKPMDSFCKPICQL